MSPANSLVVVALFILGAVLGFFGIWTLLIARSMRNGWVKQKVIEQLQSLTDSLKFPVITIPFAFWAFRVLCHVQGMRNREEMPFFANELYASPKQ